MLDLKKQGSIFKNKTRLEKQGPIRKSNDIPILSIDIPQ